jgi:RNA polymerase sigma-54 factor
MKVKQELGLQQKLELRLTPELVIFLNLLQLPITELEVSVQQELESNPFLEVGEPEIEEKIFELDRISYEQTKLRKFERSLTDPEGLEGFPLENMPEEGKSIYQHIMEQISTMNLSEEEKIIARTLLGFIDERGFIMGDEEEIANQLNLPQEMVKRVFEVMKKEIEPTGLIAKSIEERLLIQAVEEGADEVVQKIIKDYLHLIEVGKTEKIIEEMGISKEELDRAINFIKSLDPKPERIFYSPSDNRYVVPDARVFVEDGEITVDINDAGIPDLRINTELYAIYKEELKKRNDEAKKAIEMLYYRAKSFYRVKLERRKNLEKIITEIVKHNMDFFTGKDESLKPLTMKKVAELVGISEATVSRIVSGKFVDTPKGIFELKEFFTKKLKSVDGREVSADYVKKRIREIIAKEDKRRPLSDQRIADILREEKIWVARRTVAKYREEMGILDSKRRKAGK